MALLIAEYDFWKRRLNNHFFRTRKELATSSDDISAYQEMLASIPWGPGRRNLKTEWKVPDLKVIISYLEARKEFERFSVLNRSKVGATSDLGGGGGGSTVADSKHPALDIRTPSSDDLVHISEKSSVFTLGLILVELFGGKRTGLTSLTRLRHINDIFLGETGNAEFRMVMEWETHSPLLAGHQPGGIKPASQPRCACGGLSSTSSTKCPNSTLTNHGGVITVNNLHNSPPDMGDGVGSTVSTMANVLSTVDCPTASPAAVTHPTSSELSSTAAESATTTAASDSDGRSRTCPNCSTCSRPPVASYFEYYRQHAYPHEGLLSAWADQGASTAVNSTASVGKPPTSTDQHNSSATNETSIMVQNLLDHCLRFNPEFRPSLLELGAKLSELRRELISAMLASTSTSTSLTTTATGADGVRAWLVNEQQPLSAVSSRTAAARARQLWASTTRGDNKP